MQETQQKPRLFYGWIIVLAGTLIMASVMGIVFNCFSQFIKRNLLKRHVLNSSFVVCIHKRGDLSWGRRWRRGRFHNNLWLCHNFRGWLCF